MKILDYARSIKLESLEQVAKIVVEYPENEWCNEPEGFEKNLRNSPIFATRAAPIHNANGYAGSIYQFLWRKNMDYYNISSNASSPQKEWQPSETDYPTQLSAITTLPEMYTFRSKLKADLSVYKELWKDEGHKAGSEHLSRINESEYFIQRVEAQIKSLESQGVFLAAVDVKGQREAAEDQETILEPEKPSRIEKEADRHLGLLGILHELQSISNESQWIFPAHKYQDENFSELHKAGLVVKLDIWEEKTYAYLWRHDMDYENYFQVKASE